MQEGRPVARTASVVADATGSKAARSLSEQAYIE
jgi:hypothetical protein